MERSAFPLAENQAGVLASEAEAVSHHRLEASLSSGVWYTVQVTFRIRFFVVDGWRNES
jgi:hypothetical protein